MSSLELPMPLSDLESILAWVDTFKLSRPTKKINRDFSDAVLLAEILNVYYPKLVEMHNYPPRNSHSLKLNNWMTLNRKVLKKLRLNLCNNTMEQLSNCAPGVIERVLVMVRDKIRRDEDLNKSLKEGEQNLSSGGSYYEACGEDDHILVLPVKTRVNGVLEIIQKKVVSYDTYLTLKEELKDAKDSVDLLKQKAEHLENLLKLKEERIDELQKQLERKQSRRKEVEVLQNSLSVPFDEPLSPNINDLVPNKVASLKSIESQPKIAREESKIPIPIIDLTKSASKPSVTESKLSVTESKLSVTESKPSVTESKPSVTESKEITENDAVDRVRSDLFKEFDDVNSEGFQDTDDFINEIENIVTIENTIQKELKDICETNNMENVDNII